MTVEELNVIVRASQDDFDRKIRMVNENLVNAKKQAEDTSAGTLSAFKTLASGLSALGIGAMIKNAISLAGDLQQNIGGSESVFKNYAGTIQKTAETAASSLGLSQRKYLATATKMGALFQGSGFSVAQSADMVTQSMQRASDVASIMGISVDSAMEAVAGMAKGNFTMMDNLGVAINDTNLQIYAQEKGLGKLETTQQKVNAAMQMFLDKSEYAAGNYAKENDTYSGALTTFKAELEDFAAEAGTALLPLAQSVLPVLSSSLNALKPVIMTVAEAVGGIGGIVADIQAKVEAATPAQQTMLTYMRDWMVKNDSTSADDAYGETVSHFNVNNDEELKKWFNEGNYGASLYEFAKTTAMQIKNDEVDPVLKRRLKGQATWADISSLGILGYADGGFPDYGDLFIANEQGPELVGTIGNRTAVANSSTIETAIYNAVRSAMLDSTGGQSADIHVTVDIDGDTVGETVARYNAVRNRRLNGRS